MENAYNQCTHFECTVPRHMPQSGATTSAACRQFWWNFDKCKHPCNLHSIQDIEYCHHIKIPLCPSSVIPLHSLLQATTDLISITIDYFRISHQCNHTVYTLLYLASLVLLHGSVSLFLSKISLYEYTMICLPTHLLVDVCVISSLGLLWTKCYEHLCTSLCVYIYFHGQMLSVCLREIAYFFPKWLYHFTL